MASISHHPSASTLHSTSGPARGVKSVPIFHDIDQQRLRILRCTARAMAGSPGGLRFSPGARPWLDGITQIHPSGQAGRGGGISPTVND
jgi:hypothetical protein